MELNLKLKEIRKSQKLTSAIYAKERKVLIGL